MIILGIDPGYDRLGWGIINKDKGNNHFLSCGLITTNKKDTPSTRLLQIHTQLETIFASHTIDTVAIESLFFSKNVSTALPVAQAKGVILLVCKQHNIEPTEITPNQVKLAVTGSGNADKKAVEKMVRLQIKHIPEELIDDTLDALAIAMAIAVQTY